MTRPTRSRPMLVEDPGQPTPRSADAYHHGNLKVAMVEMGLKLLRSEGLQGLSVRRAAEMAGVSRTAPAHHFENRNGLLAAIAAHGYNLMLSRRMKAMRPDMSDRERLESALVEYVRFARDEPKLFHLMFGPFIENRDAYPELVEAQRAAYYMLAHLTVAAFGTIVASPGRSLQPYAGWALAHGIATLMIDQPGAPSTVYRLDADTVIRAIVKAGLDGFATLDSPQDGSA